MIKTHPGKWLNWRYGKLLLRTIAFLPYPHFTGFVDPHLPNPFLKDSLCEVWKLEEEILDSTCKSKFRRIDNVNQYVIRYLQLLKGDFIPINPFNTSVVYSYIDDNILVNAIKCLKSQKKPLLCINDGFVSDFENAKDTLCEAFNSILPNKSAFER